MSNSSLRTTRALIVNKEHVAENLAELGRARALQAVDGKIYRDLIQRGTSALPCDRSEGSDHKSYCECVRVGAHATYIFYLSALLHAYFRLA